MESVPGLKKFAMTATSAPCRGFIREHYRPAFGILARGYVRRVRTFRGSRLRERCRPSER